MSELDTTRLGPNGEKPWEPEPRTELRDIIVNDDFDDPSDVIGSYRELVPCPSSGKITFKQIGDLRFMTKNVSLDDESLLACRKPVATGELDDWNRPIYRQEEPTFDPSDFYGALWGHEYIAQRGKVLPANPINAFNEGFSQPYPTENEQEGNNFSLRGLTTEEGDDGSENFRLYSSSYGEYRFIGWDSNGNAVYDWRYYPKATYAIAYIGRIPSGTRLEWAVEVYKQRGDWRMESGFFFIRGWSEGYFGGDETEYVREEIRDTDNKWRSVSGEITIDDRHNDLYVAFEQWGGEHDTSYQNIYFRNFRFWRP